MSTAPAILRKAHPLEDRRIEVSHHAVLQFARRSRLFYIYSDVRYEYVVHLLQTMWKTGETVAHISKYRYSGGAQLKRLSGPWVMIACADRFNRQKLVLKTVYIPT